VTAAQREVIDSQHPHRPVRNRSAIPRISRSSVIRLTVTASRQLRRAPVRPPNANATARNASPRPMLRPPYRMVRPGTCSLKIFLEHPALRQKNRRTRRWITVSRPETAVSDTLRSYRLCTGPEATPQPGQSASGSPVLAGHTTTSGLEHPGDAQTGQMREHHRELRIANCARQPMAEKFSRLL
jgi:hypothetical protein